VGRLAEPETVYDRTNFGFVKLVTWPDLASTRLKAETGWSICGTPPPRL